MRLIDVASSNRGKYRTAIATNGSDALMAMGYSDRDISRTDISRQAQFDLLRRKLEIETRVLLY
jgi:hypothetical protein